MVLSRVFPAALLAGLAVRAAAASDFATTVLDTSFKFFDPD